MRSHWVRVGPDAMTAVLMGKQDTHQKTREDSGRRGGPVATSQGVLRAASNGGGQEGPGGRLQEPTERGSPHMLCF